MTKQEYQIICEDVGMTYDEKVYDNRDATISDDVLKFKFGLVKRLKGHTEDYKLKFIRALRPTLYVGRDYPKLGEILIINFNPDYVEIESNGLKRSKFNYDIEIVYNKINELLSVHDRSVKE